jgi:hypothetical protein
MRGLPALSVALLSALLALAPLARADYEPLRSGTTKLTFDRGFLELLEQNGVELSALAPAELEEGTVTLPVTGGKFDPTAARGTIAHGGALVFKAGARGLPLSALRLKTTQRRSPFSVKAGGGQLKLGAVKSMAVSRQGFASKVKVGELRLSAKLATRLAKKLRLRGVFREGLLLGEAVSRANPQTIAVLPRGKVSIALDPGIGAKLNSLFVAVNPIFPAEHPSSSFTLPILGGTIAPDGSIGSIETEGALELLQLGGGQLTWEEVWLEFGADAAGAEINVQPAPPYAGEIGRSPIAGLALAGPALADGQARTIGVNGTLILGAASAATLNEVFARPQGRDDVFAAGEALGGVALTAQGQ